MARNLDNIYSRVITEAWNEQQKDGLEKVVECPPKFRTKEGSVDFEALAVHFKIPRNKLEDDGTARVRIIGTKVQKEKGNWSNWS